MAKGIDLAEMEKKLDGLLGGEAKSKEILLIEISKKFRDGSAGALADAMNFLLESRYVGLNGWWRKPALATEAEQLEQRWRERSQKKRMRLVRAIHHGRELQATNQFELAAWIEEAARDHDNETVQRLFSLLNREYFTQERWFELEECFNAAQQLLRELGAEIEELEEKTADLQRQLLSVREAIRSKKQALSLLKGQKRPRSDRGTRGTRKPRRFTDILVRAGGQAGKIHSVVMALGLRRHGEVFGTERGMRRILKAGYEVEVIEGNESTPTGTVFSRLNDLR